MIRTALFSVFLSILCKNEVASCLTFHESPRNKFTIILRDPNLVPNTSIMKKKGVTTVPVETHAPVVFKDSYFGVEDERNKAYSVVGYLKNLSAYLVQVNFYESSEFILVTKKGQIFKVWGMPYLSPNGRTIACFSQGIAYGVYSNSVQVIDIQSDRLTERCQFTTKAYEPIGLKWTAPDEITIKAKFYDQNFNVKRTSYLSAKLTNR